MAFRGLNVQLALNDVDNSAEALNNLGLDQRDLDLISGLSSAGINSDELHTISGLVEDQKKELASLSRSSNTVGGLLTSLKDIGQPLNFNLQINNQINAAAIKYNYLDYSNPLVNGNHNMSVADISTSRVSSWSSIGSSITYGGEVEVTGQDITFSSLGTTKAPIEKKYRAEVATHELSIDIKDNTSSFSTKKFLVMKGIPLVFNTFFRSNTFSHTVTPIQDSAGNIPPVYRITNKAGGQVYESGDRALGVYDTAPGTYSFNDNTSRARTLEFFYNPANILELRIPFVNLSEWTNVSLPAIKRIDINNNDFYELPKFGNSTRNGDNLAPALLKINISSNDMSRAEDVNGNQIPANTQLNTLPTTLTHLTMNGTFRDSTPIVLTDYQDLEHISLGSLYSRDARRAMISGAVISPQTFVDSNGVKGIKSYSLDHQPFSQLDNGVCASPNLTSLSFTSCGITQKQGGGDITIASTLLDSFVSDGNAHNVVDVSGNTVIRIYQQTHSHPDSSRSRNLNGKFNGCTSLGTIHMYGSSTVASNIGADFSNKGLSSLSYLDLRWTSASGELRDSSFIGADSLSTILFAGSRHTGTDFFGTTASIAGGGTGEVFAEMGNLQWLYTYSNSNIAGPLPNFSSNANLRGLYIANTGINGNLPLLVGNNNLYYLRLNSNSMTGTIPSWTSNRLTYAYLYNNGFAGSLPALNTPYLYILDLHNNQISGNLPDMSGATRLQILYLNNNSIVGYTPEALKYNTILRTLDMSNNALNAGVGTNIISDLYDNYFLNPRSGVSINLLGNNGLSRDAIINDGSGQEENSTIAKLKYLEQFWTILLDLT